MSDTNWQFKVCKQCGYEDTRENTKLVAAFESTRVWKNACPKCGSLESERAGCAIPALDNEILEIWGKDDSLYFSDQDEHLLLAEEENIDLLLKFIDDKSLPESKRSTLLEALCVLVFDHTLNDENDHDIKPEIGNKVVDELINRIELFENLTTNDISEYIQEVVFPRLGLPVQNM